MSDQSQQHQPPVEPPKELPEEHLHEPSDEHPQAPAHMPTAAIAEDSPDQADTLQGVVADLTSQQSFDAAMMQAVDYRGDVTIRLADGQIVKGYVFDRGRDGDGPYIRLIPTTGDGRRKVSYGRIQSLIFTGKDTAEGKSWQTWVKQYEEKKARGEMANRMPEPIDET